jgi:tetratricopeptide (TPR) repeat protein/tRNA A-37 threonylcarbamoyl transferase component Bud32
MRAIDELFELALEMPAAGRAQQLLSECGGDETLCDRVLALLESDRQALGATFWDSSAMEIEARQAVDRVPIEPGRQIGRYRLVNVISSGGMGTVYRATRDDAEFQKFVAVKVIKHGMDTDLIVDRFRTERQILANLEHPNIARLLDGGTTADGLPYLVMEYVDGLPIDEYATRNQLSIPQRLQVFQTVCSAVEYAHRNLVIHRDLKPNNILVMEDGTPKLLDFGVAKLLLPGSGDAESQPAMTAIGFMTPDYASPEQVLGEAVTTISDVYSLGVLLYLLLHGRLPYRLTGRRPDEAAGAICAQQPERPSTAAIGLADDLDRIVLMAIRKEPERRYASVRMLSDDIGRFLAGLPVIAHGDTLGYRAYKFVGRHAAAVAAGSFALLCLLTAMAGIAWEARIAHAQRRRAEQRFSDVRTIANSFLFEFYDSIQNIPGTLKARQLIVTRALEYLDSLARDAGDDRALKAELAVAYDKIGPLAVNESAALEAYGKSLAINQSLVQAEPGNPRYRQQLAANYTSMATLLRDTGDSAGAVENARKAVAAIQSLVDAHPTDTSYRFSLADADQDLGKMLAQVGRAREALEAQQSALAIDEALYVRDPSNPTYRHAVMTGSLFIARLQASGGDDAAALARTRAALESAQALSALDPSNTMYRRDLWVCHFRLGEATAKLGRPAAGLAEYRKALGYIEALAVADPGDKGHQRGLAVTRLGIADLLSRLGRNAAALPEYRGAIAISQALDAADSKKGETQLDLANMYSHYGRTLQAMGQPLAATAFEKARVLFNQAARLDPANAAISEGQAALRAEMHR